MINLLSKSFFLLPSEYEDKLQPNLCNYAIKGDSFSGGSPMAFESMFPGRAWCDSSEEWGGTKKWAV